MSEGPLEGPHDENALSYAAYSIHPPKIVIVGRHPPPSPMTSCPGTPQSQLSGFSNQSTTVEITSIRVPGSMKVAIPKHVSLRSTPSSSPPRLRLSAQDATIGNQSRNDPSTRARTTAVNRDQSISDSQDLQKKNISISAIRSTSKSAIRSNNNTGNAKYRDKRPPSIDSTPDDEMAFLRGSPFNTAQHSVAPKLARPPRTPQSFPDDEGSMAKPRLSHRQPRSTPKATKLAIPRVPAASMPNDEITSSRASKRVLITTGSTRDLDTPDDEITPLRPNYSQPSKHLQDNYLDIPDDEVTPMRQQRLKPIRTPMLNASTSNGQTLQTSKAPPQSLTYQSIEMPSLSSLRSSTNETKLRTPMATSPPCQAKMEVLAPSNLGSGPQCIVTNPVESNLEIKTDVSVSTSTISHPYDTSTVQDTISDTRSDTHSFQRPMLLHSNSNAVPAFPSGVIDADASYTKGGETPDLGAITNDQIVVATCTNTSIDDTDISSMLQQAADSSLIVATDTAHLASVAGMALVRSGSNAGRFIENLLLGEDEEFQTCDSDRLDIINNFGASNEDRDDFPLENIEEEEEEEIKIRNSTAASNPNVHVYSLYSNSYDENADVNHKIGKEATFDENTDSTSEIASMVRNAQISFSEGAEGSSTTCSITDTSLKSSPLDGDSIMADCMDNDISKPLETDMSMNSSQNRSGVSSGSSKYVSIGNDGKPFIPEDLALVADNNSYDASSTAVSLDLPKGDTSITYSSSAMEIHSNTKLVTIEALDIVCGIAKGDMMLSLLSESTGKNEENINTTTHVRNAVWRVREMRKGIGILPSNSQSALETPLTSQSRKARVIIGVKIVRDLLDNATTHLKCDEFEEAAALYKDIIAIYVNASEKRKEENPRANSDQKKDELDETYFRSQVGTALHNLAIIYLLDENYNKALIFFQKAAETRRLCLGNEHADHVVSGLRWTLLFSPSFVRLISYSSTMFYFCICRRHW